MWLWCPAGRPVIFEHGITSTCVASAKGDGLHIILYMCDWVGRLVSSYGAWLSLNWSATILALGGSLIMCVSALVYWSQICISGISDKYLPTLQAVIMFRYSPFVRFPSTVGKFDASERNRECLFIYHFVTYRCECECLSNKPITHTVWHTLGSLYNAQLLADLSRVPVVGTRLVVQP